MLGKLFNLTTGAVAGTPTSQAQTSKPTPESVQEDIHTRSLLFPDVQALYSRSDQVFNLPTAASLPSTSSINGFDYDGEIELDVRDVRVIIMQDSLGSVNPSLLYDSQPCSPPAEGDRSSTTSPVSRQNSKRTPTSPRKASTSGVSTRPLVINQPGSPQLRQGAFDRRSYHSRTQSSAETEAQRAYREYRDELTSFSACIFANTEVMSYKGTSTKVHIIPSDPRTSDIPVHSYTGDGRGSIGRSSIRSSRLGQSFTADTQPTAPFTVPTTTNRPVNRRKVLITRLFPVNLPTDPETPNTAVTPHSRFSDDSSGFPFPYSPDETNQKKKKAQPKQKRTPMYAVALVVQLPPTSPRISSSATKPSFRGPSSYNEQDSFPSSYNSARRSDWTVIGSGFGVDSFESSYSNEMEDCMEAITQHWDVVMRTLSNLQSAVAATLLPMLKQQDMASPDPQPPLIISNISRVPSVSTRRGSTASQMKPPKTNAKLVTLPPNCLVQESRIEAEVDVARARIVSGLRATRVVTGQGRWGPWREEARWVAKWAGGKDQGFFFFNLLTGFLATHTDWLQALSPPWYRKRHHQLQKGKPEEDTSLPSRTVIVANDKMAARRLIFLLSAFLPASQQLPTHRHFRPGTSASFSNFSHSPPSFFVSGLKEESLRRKINRRTGPRGHSHTRSFSIQSHATTKSSTAIPAQLAHLSMDSHHERRASDATLFKASNLPLSSNDMNARKCSAATTATITPDAIPHFSTSEYDGGTLRRVRPGSITSLAADDLKRSLERGDSSASTDSRSQSSRWGSVISGLWSARRRDSTNTTSHTLESPGSRDGNLASPAKIVMGRKDKLAEMAREAQVFEDTPTREHFDENDLQPLAQATESDTPSQPGEPSTGERSGSISKPSRTPDPTGAFESPIKTSINEDDSVIDVDVPFPDYITSFESAISSPSSSGYLSTPGFGVGLDAFEQVSRLAIEGDLPLNVAGWLHNYHADFALQAIPPQPDLLEKIKASMKAEPTPAIYGQPFSADWANERWVDVSTAIVADTTTFSIKRIRYRRFVKPKPGPDKYAGPLTSTSTSSVGNAYGSSWMTPALSPYEREIKDDFIEEDFITLDEVLADAVEKVIAQGSDASKGSSSASSRSTSKRRDRNNSVSIHSDDVDELIKAPATLHEISRAECKTVILSALSEIIHEEVESRERDGHEDRHRRAREKETILREAIREWLNNAETGD